MIINQLGRRNVIDFVRGEMALELKKLLREVAEENSRSKLKQFQVFDNEESTDSQRVESRKKKTRKERNDDCVDSQVGKAAGMSREQIRRIELLKETATPEEREELQNRKTSAGLG